MGRAHGDQRVFPTPAIRVSTSRAFPHDTDHAVRDRRGTTSPRSSCDRIRPRRHGLAWPDTTRRGTGEGPDDPPTLTIPGRARSGGAASNGA